MGSASTMPIDSKRSPLTRRSSESAGSRPGLLYDTSTRRIASHVRSAWQMVRIPSGPSPLLDTSSVVSVLFMARPRPSVRSKCLRPPSTLDPKSSEVRLGAVISMRAMPAASVSRLPTPLPARLSVTSLSFFSMMSQSACSPVSLSSASCFEKSHEGLRLASRLPRKPPAMRHVLFMNGLFRNLAAVASVAQPSQPSWA